MMWSASTEGMLWRSILLLSFLPDSSTSASPCSAVRSCRCHSLWMLAALLEFVAMSAERIRVATVGASSRLVADSGLAGALDLAPPCSGEAPELCPP